MDSSGGGSWKQPNSTAADEMDEIEAETQV